MGVHTVTRSPWHRHSLTDKEYQILRDASIAVLREIGVDTGVPTCSLRYRKTGAWW